MQKNERRQECVSADTVHCATISLTARVGTGGRDYTTGGIKLRHGRVAELSGALVMLLEAPFAPGMRGPAESDANVQGAADMYDSCVSSVVKMALNRQRLRQETFDEKVLDGYGHPGCSVRGGSCRCPGDTA